MFEVFSLIDGNSPGTTAEDDRRISYDEWVKYVPRANNDYNTWAHFIKLQNAKDEDF